MKKHLGFLLNLLAIGLFIPGITLPIFNLAMDVTAKVSATSLSSDIVNKELSLLGTIDELWQDERIVVAVLIFAFSIAIAAVRELLPTPPFAEATAIIFFIAIWFVFSHIIQVIYELNYK